MNIAYIHTGKWPSNSPSITFTTYNALGAAEVFDFFYFFIKKNFRGSAEEIFRDNFNQCKPPHLIMCPLKNIFNSNKIYLHRIAGILSGLIKQGKLNALITRNPGFLPFLINLNQKYNIPVFYETHDFFTDDSGRHKKFNRHQKKYQVLEQKFIPNLSGVICLQNPQMNLYKKYYPGQRFVLARTGVHQVSPADFKLRKYLTYIGSLDQHKGVGTVLEAVKMCSRTDLEVLIIGGKHRQEIEYWERKLINNRLSSRVTVTGWINKNRLSHYLNQTLLGVIPLEDSFFNRYLTSPLKLFDYLSHGIPVIASDLNSLRDIIDENRTGVFFKPGDPENLALEIDRLYSDKEQLITMSNHARARAAELTWKKRSEIIRDFINEF
ncbi:MAG: glycosyltransferase [bacterium]